MARTKNTARINPIRNQPSQAHQVLEAIQAAQRAQMGKPTNQTTQQGDAQSNPQDMFKNLTTIEDINRPTATRTPIPQFPLTEEEQNRRVLEEQQRQIDEEAERLEEERLRQFEEECRAVFEDEQAILRMHEEEHDEDAYSYWTAQDARRQMEDRLRREEQDRVLAAALQSDLERPAQGSNIKMRFKCSAKRLKITPRHPRTHVDEQTAQNSQEDEERLEREAQLRQEEARERRPLQDPTEVERRKKHRNERPPWHGQSIPPPPETQKRKRRWRPGTVALREIRKYQKSTDPILNKAPFARVVKEVIDKYADRVTRVQSSALGALQEASETILVSLFQDSVLCHAHAKRVTLKPLDMALALRLRQDDSLHKTGEYK